RGPDAVGGAMHAPQPGGERVEATTGDRELAKIDETRKRAVRRERLQRGESETRNEVGVEGRPPVTAIAAAADECSPRETCEGREVDPAERGRALELPEREERVEQYRQAGSDRGPRQPCRSGRHDRNRDGLDLELGH